MADLFDALFGGSAVFDFLGFGSGGGAQATRRIQSNIRRLTAESSGKERQQLTQALTQQLKQKTAELPGALRREAKRQVIQTLRQHDVLPGQITVQVGTDRGQPISLTFDLATGGEPAIPAPAGVPDISPTSIEVGGLTDNLPVADPVPPVVRVPHVQGGPVGPERTVGTIEFFPEAGFGAQPTLPVTRGGNMANGNGGGFLSTLSDVITGFAAPIVQGVGQGLSNKINEKLGLTKKQRARRQAAVFTGAPPATFVSQDPFGFPNFRFGEGAIPPQFGSQERARETARRLNEGLLVPQGGKFITPDFRNEPGVVQEDFPGFPARGAPHYTQLRPGPQLALIMRNLPSISRRGATQIVEMAGRQGQVGGILDVPGSKTDVLVDQSGSVLAKIRKTPSMNPLNPRALRRAHRRVQTFERFVKRNFSITKRSTVKPKKRRRK